MDDDKGRLMKTFTVDIPNALDLNGAWIEIGEFDTKEKAIEFVQNLFGADDEGKINLISEIDLGEDY